MLGIAVYGTPSIGRCVFCGGLLYADQPMVVVAAPQDSSRQPGAASDADRESRHIGCAILARTNGVP